MAPESSTRGHESAATCTDRRLRKPPPVRLELTNGALLMPTIVVQPPVLSTVIIILRQQGKGRGRDGAGDAEAGVALHRQRGAVAAQVHGGRPGGAQGHVAAAGVVRRAGGGAVVGAGGGGRGRARRLGRPRCALDPLGGGQHPVGPPRPPRGLLRQGGGYGRGVRRHQGGQQRLEGSRVARPQATHFGPSHPLQAVRARPNLASWQQGDKGKAGGFDGRTRCGRSGVGGHVLDSEALVVAGLRFPHVGSLFLLLLCSFLVLIAKCCLNANKVVSDSPSPSQL